MDCVGAGVGYLWVMECFFVMHACRLGVFKVCGLQGEGDGIAVGGLGELSGFAGNSLIWVVVGD